MQLPTGVHVRDARPADAEAIHALYHAAYAPGQDAHRDASGKPLRDSVDDVRGFLRERALLVAEDEKGALVGTVALRAIANVRRLAVHPSQKKSGLGAALLDAIAERARHERFDVAQLETQHDHPWLPQFYARRGYVERGVETMTDGTKWLVMRQRL